MGLIAYPPRRQPIWPTWEEVERRDYGSKEPDNENGTHVNYGVTWTYYFACIGPF